MKEEIHMVGETDTKNNANDKLRAKIRRYLASKTYLHDKRLKIISSSSVTATLRVTSFTGDNQHLNHYAFIMITFIHYFHIMYSDSSNLQFPKIAIDRSSIHAQTLHV